MQLPEELNLTIKTKCDFFTAIYKRVYYFQTHEQNNGVATISLSSKDFTPSGYIEGGKNQILIEFDEYKVPQNMTIKAFVAKLILKTDTNLKVITGCEHLNKSRKIITDKLVEYSKHKKSKPKEV